MNSRRLRRHDMWVNLLQRLAEAILFFNPAVWYLSRRISTVREFCCDAVTCRTLAAAPEQSKTEYALALLRVVELARGPQAPRAATDANGADDLLALAAAGRTALELRTRIEALYGETLYGETLHGEPVRERLRLSTGGWLTVAALALAVLLAPLSWRMAAQSTGKTPESDQARIQPTPPVIKPNTTKPGTDLSHYIVTIEAESRPQAIFKSFPAIVMVSSAGKSLLLSASWGAEPFPLSNPGVPIGALFLSEGKDPVGIVAYDIARGIAVFSVNRAIAPFPGNVLPRISGRGIYSRHCRVLRTSPPARRACWLSKRPMRAKRSDGKRSPSNMPLKSTWANGNAGRRC